MEAYKERFIKEFWELNERVTKLGNMLTKYDDGTLDFTPACPINMLRTQFYAMATYRSVLIERSRVENIDLTLTVKA